MSLSIIMASMDDTCFDISGMRQNMFSDMGSDNIFRNDPPISGYPDPEHSRPFDIEQHDDDPFFNEDEKAVMGLESSIISMDGSFSPSSYTSDDVPTTPLYDAEFESFDLLANPAFVSPNPSEFQSKPQESPTSCDCQEEQPSSNVPVQPTDPTKESAMSPKAASPTAVSRQEQSRKMIVRAVDVKPPSPLPSTRQTAITVNTADESSDVRQDKKNNLPVACKSEVMKVGVKRKTYQDKEEAKKLKPNPEDSSPISRNQKNAIAARENRLKKKMELEELKRNEVMLDNENQCLHFGQRELRAAA